MFKVDLVSIDYGGTSIGNDLVFESTIDRHTKTFRADLRPGHTFSPPAGIGELYPSSAIPARVGTTVDLSFRVTEKDAFRDDKGSATCTFTIPQVQRKGPDRQLHGFRERIFEYGELQVHVQSDMHSSTIMAEGMYSGPKNWPLG